MDNRYSRKLRLIIAAGVAVAWAGTALVWALNRASLAPSTPSPVGGVGDSVQQSVLRGQTRYLYPLLTTVANSCPGNPATLALTDDALTYQLGNYLLYPHYLKVLNPLEGVDEAMLQSHAGGCIFYYITGREELEPFMARLEQITCVEGGCLYSIEK